ncbi:hypothetical protein CHS0354_042090 [Potamilus streckersoni]|uniref:Uncharacterized protein n=1 Tax=Potamilus streckersoni TaxID=2493646 RepID=A0AAE0TN71_9BIVA|nr:hypothetical protein CHS0354_042090 [Potamilus streckersoni]
MERTERVFKQLRDYDQDRSRSLSTEGGDSEALEQYKVVAHIVCVTFQTLQLGTVRNVIYNVLSGQDSITHVQNFLKIMANAENNMDVDEIYIG